MTEAATAATSAPAATATQSPKATEAQKASAAPVDAKAAAQNAGKKAADIQAGKAGEGDKAGEQKKEAAPEAAKTFKLVVRGKEVDVPAEHYHRLAQKGLAADMTLKEFAEMKKSADAFVNALKNPATLWKVLQRLGHDPLKIASEYVYDRGVRREGMSPEARELEDLKERQAEQEAENKRRQEEEMTRAEQAKVAHWQNAFSRDIIAAMDATPELPKTAETVSRLAFYMRQALRNRDEHDDTPIRAIDFVPKVLEEFRALTRSFLQNRQGKDILDLVGDDVRKKVRAAELEAIEKTPQSTANVANGTPVPSSGRKMSKDEWDALVAKRAGM